MLLGNFTLLIMLRRGIERFLLITVLVYGMAGFIFLVRYLAVKIHQTKNCPPKKEKVPEKIIIDMNSVHQDFQSDSLEFLVRSANTKRLWQGLDIPIIILLDGLDEEQKKIAAILHNQIHGIILCHQTDLNF